MLTKEQPELFTVVTQGRNQWDSPTAKFKLPPRVRKHDHETSKAAAKGVDPRQLDRVYECLLAHPEGLTDYQISKLLVIEKGSAAKRRGELEHQGLVEKTEDKRPTNTGRPAIVWRAK